MPRHDRPTGAHLWLRDPDTDEPIGRYSVLYTHLVEARQLLRDIVRAHPAWVALQKRKKKA